MLLTFRFRDYVYGGKDLILEKKMNYSFLLMTEKTKVKKDTRRILERLIASLHSLGHMSFGVP